MLKSKSIWIWNKLLRKNVDVNKLKESHKEFLKDNTLILKILQKFKSETHNVFTEEVNKVALSAKDGKRIQLFDCKNHIHMEEVKM